MEELRVKPEMVMLARRARMLSQKELADSIGVSQGSVWRM